MTTSSMSKVGGKAFDFKLFTKVMAYARPYRGLLLLLLLVLL